MIHYLYVYCTLLLQIHNEKYRQDLHDKQCVNVTFQQTQVQEKKDSTYQIGAKLIEIEINFPCWHKQVVVC